MPNICDYIKWRGDLELKQSEFNEIDALILSRFSYFPFDRIIKENETVTIKELSERFKKEDINKMEILWETDKELFPLMGQSERFGKMKATKYINKINVQQEKQFSAITILMPDDTIFISFRGTDNTIVGWKEDFNMSFKSHIASQKESVKYLEEIANEYSNNIRLGGHSKGGNLAVYSAVYADSKIKDRIINIYNNDGPGFDDEIINANGYKEIIEKVHTYIPQSSIIGRLLNHQEKYTIIESTQKGIMQHDLYSWQIEGKNFITLDEVTDGSEIIDKTIKKWLENVTPQRREKVIDALFEILNTTEINSITEIREKWFSNTKRMLQKYKNVDNETKEIIMQTLHELIRVAKNTIFQELPKKTRYK